jgi:hypothetical protein
MAYVLEINPQTLDSLVHNGSIPHTYTQLPDSNGQTVRFNPYLVTEWLRTNPQIEISTGQQYLDGLRQHYRTQFSSALKTLKKSTRSSHQSARLKDITWRKFPAKNTVSCTMPGTFKTAASFPPAGIPIPTTGTPRNNLPGTTEIKYSLNTISEKTQKEQTRTSMQ